MQTVFSQDVTQGTVVTSSVQCPVWKQKLAFTASLSTADQSDPTLRVIMTVEIKDGQAPGGWKAVQEAVWCGCAATPTVPSIVWQGDFRAARLEFDVNKPVSIGWAASSTPVNGGA